MPEPSDSDRRKAAQLEPWLAGARLVDALERGWDIHFRCQFCGTTKTWRRDTLLGRARALLGCTLAQIQRKDLVGRGGEDPLLTLALGPTALWPQPLGRHKRNRPGPFLGQGHAFNVAPYIRPRVIKDNRLKTSLRADHLCADRFEH